MGQILDRKFCRFCVALGIAFWLPMPGVCEKSDRPATRELTIYTEAQGAPLDTDSAIDALVQSLAAPLKAAKAKNVVVLDLRGPDGGLYAAGKWISDPVSVAMRTEFPKLKIIDRTQLTLSDETPGAPTEESALFKKEIQEARSVGANVAVAGNFAGVSGQIDVSLAVVKLAGLERTHEMRSGLIPIPKGTEDRILQTIPPLDLEDGFPRAGRGGINMPVCTHCPNLANGLSGTVILEVVVTQDGRPDRIKILRSPSPEIEAAAVKTVQAWSFKPAIGFDGKPIAVITPIQITFR
jgi:TonB family protein